MLSRDEAQEIFRRVLTEFAPEWEPIGPLTEVTTRDPHHWLSGIGTFGVMLQHRGTGAIKSLGRREGAGPGVTYHRGVSFVVLEAYGERNTDPIRRYLEEIGVAQRPARSSARTA